MIGNPKFHKGDIVNFKYFDATGNEIHKTGVICIIDKFGTFFNKDDVNYDIMVKNDKENVFYKHVTETLIQEKIGYELDYESMF